jgi:outer membrane protein OmpA-like peptidoglycan-associated protein
MGARPSMNKVRSLKFVISGALVAALVAGMGAIGATPAIATPAPANPNIVLTINGNTLSWSAPVSYQTILICDSRASTVAHCWSGGFGDLRNPQTSPTYVLASHDGPSINHCSNGSRLNSATINPSLGSVLDPCAPEDDPMYYSTHWQWQGPTGTPDPTSLHPLFGEFSSGDIPAGTYKIMVADNNGNASNYVSWTVAAPASSNPTISTQPASASKTVGEALSLSVTATGAGTLSYQWKKSGTAISGATSATFSIPSVATSDAGSYTVDVTNTESNKTPATVTSSAAVVTITAAPVASTPSVVAATPAVAPKAAIEFKIPEGKPVAAAPVDVEVEGLKDQSRYTITVRSTPIIVEEGTIFNSRLKTSIRIPAGLSPGWHSITIDATAADGTPWNEVMYFEVSASGLLKSTSNVRKANPGAISFSAGTSSLSSATKKNIRATVKQAGKSAKYTVTGTAGQMTGVSDKAVRALAKKRANVLKAHLVKLGVSKSSITIKTKVVKQGKRPKASVLALY